MTPEEGFESAQFLVAWAQDQLSEAEALARTFYQSVAYTVVEGLDHKTGCKLVKLRFKPLPPKLRGLTNNIIKDARDALDQAANAASRLVAGKANLRNCHFPFGSSPHDFDIAVTKNQCRDIPAVLYPVLKSYQPYPTGNGWDGGDDNLRMLGAISGGHKHRVTLTPAVHPSSVVIKDVEFPKGRGTLIAFPEGRLAKKDEILVARVPLGTKVKFETDVSSYVAFADAKMKGVSVGTFLTAALQSVRFIVQDLQAQALKIAGR